MTDISGIFSISSSTNPQWISLCGHLEAVIGNYLLSQAGNPEAYWYAIYYDSSVDGYNECVEITDKNLIGYVYCDDRVAFVNIPVRQHRKSGRRETVCPGLRKPLMRVYSRNVLSKP